jgi:ADP-heptose:LPS heptosyltransferase
VRRDPLGVLAALLGRAALLVANDSAPIHLAEAAGTPTLYFAHHEKLVHSHPAGERALALFDDLANRVVNVSVEQALGAARFLLGRG